MRILSKRLIPWVSVLMSFALFLGMMGCGGSAGSGSTAKKLVRYLEKGEYASAVELYASEVLGNSADEIDWADTLNSFLNELAGNVLSGKADSTLAQGQRDAAERVIDNMDSYYVYQYDCMDALSQVDNALQSKAAYLSGEELFSLGSYSAALEKFQCVLEEDADYSKAQSRIKEIKTIIENDALSEAETYALTKDYAAATRVLQEALAIIPDSETLLAKEETYSAVWLDSVLQDAKNVFTDYTKYMDAIAIINGGRQYLGDEGRLMEALEYYNQYAPVSLADIEPFAGYWYWGSKTDLFGNSYAQAHESGGFTGDSATWALDGKYDVFSFILSGNSSAQRYVRLTIYGDTVKIYENTAVDTQMRPKEITINVTGVTDLKIEVGESGWVFLFAEPVLQKTSIR